MKGERVDEVINNLPTGNFYHKSQRTRERECNTDLEKCLEEPGLLKSFNEKEICGKQKTLFVTTLDDYDFFLVHWSAWGSWSEYRMMGIANNGQADGVKLYLHFNSDGLFHQEKLKKIVNSVTF